MRKVVAIENVTLDGIADSQEGLGFEWTARAYDDEVDRYSNEHVRADVDMAMYGRATYLGMQGFWSQMLDNPQARRASEHTRSGSTPSTRSCFRPRLNRPTGPTPAHQPERR